MLIQEFMAVLHLFCGLRYVSGDALDMDWVIKKPVACYMKPDYGTCKRHLTRYFYNDSNYKCRTFDYSGCGGNGNNFDTRRECRYLCGVKYDPDKDPCLRPPGRTWCPNRPEYAGMWYFDKKTEKCVRFTYRECALNRNVFPSCDKCKKECQRHMHVLQTCPE
uniref:Tissue factor pathway inhibitor n=1 Tax=Rhipicephalus appendiculatus TaxID=34631 RepID=A0A131YPV4_RHIAP